MLNKCIRPCTENRKKYLTGTLNSFFCRGHWMSRYESIKK